MAAKSKKDKEIREKPGAADAPDGEFEGAPLISTKEELKAFLVSLRDKMTEQTAAPVYAMGALNHVLNLPSIYSILDKDNKEIARDIWLRLKQSGVHLRNPPLLFGVDEDGLSA